MTFARTVDIPRAAYNFRFFATSVLHHLTECSQMDRVGCLNYTIRCPVGVGESSVLQRRRLRAPLRAPLRLFFMCLHRLVLCSSGSDQPLEFPPLPAHLEDRACHRGWEHRGGQTQRDDLGDRLDGVQTDAAGW